MSFESGVNNKTEVWNSIVKQVETIVDGVGEPVDEGVKEPVVALKTHGFGTKSSCEGHLDWGYPYPWIEVGSQLSEADNRISSRFSVLKKSLRKERTEGQKMSDADKVEFEELVNKQAVENEEALQRLDELLVEFNETLDDKSVGLELVYRDWSGARLQSMGVDTSSVRTLKEELAKIPKEELENKLRLYQGVMQSFGLFLKEKYFKS